MSVSDHKPANLLPERGEALFYPGFFAPAEADAVFHALRSNISWEQVPIKIFGREIISSPG